jgi:alpha-2-macroglobulin-like protein
MGTEASNVVRRALDQFGRASEDITNAYIVYGLSEAGSREIRKELDKVYGKAMESKDPYQLALAANSLFNFNDDKNAAKTMETLYKLQAKNGSWTGASHSITYSQGISLTIETTSLTILAMIKSTKPDQAALTKAVEFLLGSRSGSGGFSSTQGTVLALKALTEYAKYSKKTDENGTIELYVDGKKIAEKSYLAGEKEAISINGLEKYISKGKHTLRIRYKGVENPLPYSMAVNWNTSLPDNDEECKVSIDTKLSSKSAFVGETVRLTTVIKNTTKEGLPSTMAIVGIPAGLSPQPWQLKELTEKKKIDFYEIRDNNIFFYYRQMLPEETREIHLDLKAEIAGEYEAQASSGYLYYTNEYKVWSAPERIVLKRK